MAVTKVSILDDLWYLIYEDKAYEIRMYEEAFKKMNVWRKEFFCFLLCERNMCMGAIGGYC